MLVYLFPYVSSYLNRRMNICLFSYSFGFYTLLASCCSLNIAPLKWVIFFKKFKLQIFIEVFLDSIFPNANGKLL